MSLNENPDQQERSPDLSALQPSVGIYYIESKVGLEAREILSPEDAQRREELFPHWRNAYRGPKTYLRPFYRRRCETTKEFNDAHRLKPPHVRAEIEMADKNAD